VSRFRERDAPLITLAAQDNEDDVVCGHERGLGERSEVLAARSLGSGMAVPLTHIADRATGLFKRERLRETLVRLAIGASV
jgi:hypothetical protein